MALFVLVCTITVYEYGTSIALAIWLGTCLPCGAICTFFGAWCDRTNREESDDDCRSAGKILFLCGPFSCLTLLVGLTAACIWLAPWYLISQNPALSNVDAFASDWIGNRTAPTAGSFVFYFPNMCWKSIFHDSFKTNCLLFSNSR